ncbi:hypothetical protein [Vreelandella nanhaiensis]|uniref:Uncharacterized protein n=1 Tax=Vreelandella nanhaiensis TaxID=1258546 RepID=A0A433KXR9_9GAMM|nr:hypothetical protein [Halomonas nanhaiensis]RUR34466.1 hypothetical protein ELY38_02430 [Halomonas nanhaiensis]
MATAPTVPNFSQFNFVVDDRAAVITKQNGVNAALEQFGNSLKAMTDSINVDLETMEGQKAATQQAATAASTDAAQVALDKQAVASDRTHVDQQKSAIDTTAGQVEGHAQQVATDRQAVATDTATATQAASDASTAADASIQAKSDAQALYGDLSAVDAAKTAAQQAATTAAEERGLAVTAREGAESAQTAAETAAGESQSAASAAVQTHVDKDDPHTQYEQKTKLKDAAYCDVVGGSGPLMSRGAYGVGVSGGGIPITSNARDIATGLYVNNNDYSDGGLPKGGGNFNILHQKRASGGGETQLWQRDSLTAPAIFYRSRTAGPWSAFFEICHSNNIVGTVSQSGGIPTGAVIESDSNSFWRWVKLADGTMIAYAEFRHPDASINVPSGNIYRTESFIPPDLPPGFVDIRPKVSTDYRAANTTDVWGSSAGGGSTTRPFDSYRFLCGRAQTGLILVLHLTVHGRWY